MRSSEIPDELYERTLDPVGKFLEDHRMRSKPPREFYEFDQTPHRWRLQAEAQTFVLRTLRGDPLPTFWVHMSPRCTCVRETA